MKNSICKISRSAISVLTALAILLSFSAVGIVTVHADNDTTVGSTTFSYCLDVLQPDTCGVHIGGWVYNTKNTSHTFRMEVYIGGPYNGSYYQKCAGFDFLQANVERPDVNNAHNCGNNHGFSITVPYYEPGVTRSVYIYAINNSTGDRLLLHKQSFSMIFNSGWNTNDIGYYSSTSERTYEKNIRWWRVKPTYSGTHVFYSYGGYANDTYGYLYKYNSSTKALEQVATNDDGGYNNNFQISQYLYSNTTYFIGVRFYSSYSNDNTTRTLKFYHEGSLNEASVSLSSSSYTYDGSAKTPTPTVTAFGSTVSSSNYSVSYSNNTNAGTATVTITGNANNQGSGKYFGSCSKTFTISAKSISGCTVTLSPTSYTYDGSAKTPSVTVKDGSTTLTSGTHYTVSYSNNTNVGTATVTITGKGNYTGSITRNFTIVNTSIPECTITLSPTSYIYDGTAKTPTVTVTNGSTTLTKDTHYTVSYSNNTNIGTAIVTVTGLGSYTGTATKTFAINARPLSGCTVALGQDSYVYDGSAKLPDITVTDGSTTLTKDTDYSLSYSNNTNAGTASVVVTGMGIYAGTVTKTFEIAAKPVSECTITLNPEMYLFDGSPKTPTVTVTDGGTVLVQDTDYTLVISNNTEIGTANAVISGIGNYTGTVTKTFEIIDLDTTPPEITDASVGDITRTSFKVYANCSDNVGIDRVSAEIWTKNDQSDQISTQLSADGEGVYFANVLRSALSGSDNYLYHIKIYVYDAENNCATAILTQDYRIASEPEKTVDEGVYRFASFGDISKMISENESNVSVSTDASDSSCTFRLVYLNNGFYKIINLDSEKAVSVYNNTYEIGTNVITGIDAEEMGQQWKIDVNDDGTCTFISRCSGLVLSVENSDNVGLYEADNGMVQSWYLRSVLCAEDLSVELKNVTVKEGVAPRPKLTVSKNGQTLFNFEYTVSDWNIPLEGGVGSAVITGKDNFCGSVTVNFTASVRAFGDIDGNGSVTVSDATLLQKYLTKYPVDLTEEQLMFADVNGDDKVDIIDVTEIQRLAARIISQKKIYSFSV